MLSVVEQYRAMTGNLMVWILGPGVHPLRSILQAHIKDLSNRWWGVPDLSWIVTKGGSLLSQGSPAWQNVCKAWSSLKSFIRKVDPRNMEEWRALPLWSPHVHHITESKAQCTTQAQGRLRAAGLLTTGIFLMLMANLSSGKLFSWITTITLGEEHILLFLPT